MEVDVTTQFDDESIRMESGKFMEDRNEHDFKQVTNQEPLLVQETFVPTKQISNSLPTNIEPVQLVQSKPIQPIQLDLFTFFLKH